MDQSGTGLSASGGYGGYGGPPGGGGYGPPPGAPPGGGGYGPPPGAPGGYGPPPGPVAAQPPAPTVPGAPPPAKKKPPIGLIVGLIVGLVALGGAGYAAYWYFGSAGARLAKYAPKDAQIYVEVPSMPKGLAKFVDIDAVDDKELDAEKRVDDLIEGLADAFDISKDEAKEIVTSVGGMSVAVREPTKKPGFAMVVEVGSKDGMEKLLGSKRFSREGDMNGCTQYEIERPEIDFDKIKKMSAWKKTFTFMSVEGDSQAFVWCPDKKLIVTGEKDMVEDTTKVIKGDKDALDKNENFKKAKWDKDSVMLAYVDSDLLDEADLKDARDDYFKDIPPFTGALRFVDAGMVTTVQGYLHGAKVPKDEFAGEPVKMTLADRLPDTTIGYYAFTAASKLSGKEIEETFIKQLKREDKESGREFEKELEAMQKEMGISVESIFDAIGDEGIIAVTATEKVKMGGDELDPEDLAKNIGVMLALHVGDKDAAKKLVKVLREKVFEDGPLKDKIDVKKEDSGFTAKIDDEKVPVQIKVTFEGDYLLIVAGTKDRVKDFTEAFTGAGKTLKEDKAHAKAMAAFTGKPLAVMWFDSGRVTRDILKEMKEIKDELKEQGIPVKALKVEGDDRMTSAFAINLTAKDEVWTYKLEGLNLAGLAPLGALAARAKNSVPSMGLGGGGGSGSGGSGGGSTPTVGQKDCDEYLNLAYNCSNTAMRDSYRQNIDTLKSTYKTGLDNAASRDTIIDSCKKAADGIRSFCK